MASAVQQKEKADDFVKIRVTPSEKKAYDAAAGGRMKRSKWVKQILNKFCGVN